MYRIAVMTEDFRECCAVLTAAGRWKGGIVWTRKPGGGKLALRKTGERRNIRNFFYCILIRFAFIVVGLGLQARLRVGALVIE